MHRLIMGKNCVLELFKAAPERIVEIYTSVEDPEIPGKRRSKKELTDMVQSDSHQGYVARVQEPHHPTLKEFLSQDKQLVLMLDSIYDPHNLGAIYRAAECFGVDLIVFSKNRGTDITPAVSKVSVGATELVPTLKVSNLAESIKPFQDAGYWVVAADADGESAYSYDFPDKMVLILGSEGEGLRPLLRKKADAILSIPMRGNIDSLNVSQAAAVLLALQAAARVRG